jgi:hypothetical protein
VTATVCGSVEAAEHIVLLDLGKNPVRELLDHGVD